MDQYKSIPRYIKHRSIVVPSRIYPPISTVGRRPVLAPFVIALHLHLALGPVATRKLPSSSNSGRDVEFFATGTCSASRTLVLPIAQKQLPTLLRHPRNDDSRIIVFISSAHQIDDSRCFVPYLRSSRSDPKFTASGVKTYPINHHRAFPNSDISSCPTIGLAQQVLTRYRFCRNPSHLDLAHEYSDRRAYR